MNRQVTLVADWIREGNKIYLVAKSGKRYRYAGKRTMEQMEKEYPRGSELSIVYASRRVPTVITDDTISL